ncbi:hypothetical protein V8F06_013261 [Rhypophila decipiens]
MPPNFNPQNLVVLGSVKDYYEGKLAIKPPSFHSRDDAGSLGSNPDNRGDISDDDGDDYKSDDDDSDDNGDGAIDAPQAWQNDRPDMHPAWAGIHQMFQQVGDDYMDSLLPESQRCRTHQYCDGLCSGTTRAWEVDSDVGSDLEPVVLKAGEGPSSIVPAFEEPQPEPQLSDQPSVSQENAYTYLPPSHPRQTHDPSPPSQVQKWTFLNQLEYGWYSRFSPP